MATRFLVIDGKIVKDTRTGLPVALTDNIFTSVTYDDLKTMRDNGHLLSGEQYRITDFVTTTSQENTQSAGHPFDIIVVADSANTLNENARAVAHEGDTYFANSKLSSWEIKYCFDNDKSRFAWARDYVPASSAWFTSGYDSGTWYATGGTYEHNGVTYYVFYNEFVSSTLYSEVPVPTPADSNKVYINFDGSGTLEDDGSPIETFGDGSEIPEGKGVIYYMKDEWGNECPYDFKNIMFMTNNANYVYTFADGNNDDSLSGNTSKNIIIGVTGREIRLGYNTFGAGCMNNILEADCQRNTFGNNCSSNTIGAGSINNTFGNNCSANTLGDGSSANTLGNGCTDNTFGSNCKSNTFGIICSNNIVDNGVKGAQPQPTTGAQAMQGIHIHYGVTGQFTVTRGANYTQDVRTANDVTITV